MIGHFRFENFSMENAPLSAEKIDEITIAKVGGDNRHMSTHDTAVGLNFLC